MTETEPPYRLPRANEAQIPLAKLRDYALNPDHPRGRDKARVFRSVFNISRDDAEYLRQQIRERLPRAQVERIDRHRRGATYQVTLLIDGLNGATYPVATRWIVRGDEPPSLSTLWVDL